LELEEFWGRSTAKKFFTKKRIILFAQFDSVWWVGYNQAISDYPKMSRTFITKEVSGWCGCNSKLLLWEENIINPQCGYKNENSKHLTCCRDPGRSIQLHNSMETIMDVPDDANVVSKLATKIKAYLLEQGRRPMVDCTHPTSKLLLISINIDNLRWDCFVQGQIPYSLFVSIKPMYLG
jgi:hypothetical protein